MNPLRCSPRFSRVLVLLFGLLLLVLHPARAASVTLLWDRNAEPDVAGYKLYYGTPAGNYDTVIDALNVTNYTVADVVAGNTYRFYVTCYNTAGLESEPSNAVDYTVPGGTNAPPQALPQTLQVQAGQILAITLTGSDPEGAPLSFTLLDSPTHGRLDGYPPAMTYQAHVDYAGPDTFRFTVSDGFLDSPPATISLEVLPGNAPPVANAQSVQTLEDQALSITLSGADPDNNALTYALTAPPQHGTLSGPSPQLVYRPATNYTGGDQFSFTASDGQLTSVPAVVSLTVNPVNDAPTADPQTRSINAGANLAITLTGSDVEGSPLTFTVVSQPAHGSLSGSAPNLQYTAAAGYAGADSFNFRVSDGAAQSAPATVSITVVGENQAPIVNAGHDQVVTLPGNAVLLGSVTDDGLINPFTTRWTRVTGPANVTFNKPRALSTKVRFSKAGTYVLRLTASDGALSTPDDVTVSVGTLASTPAPGVPFTLYLEAETGELSAPMAVALNNLPGQSTNAYIATATAEQGTASFAFEIPADGEYIVWCRVLTPTKDQDSFYVSLDHDPATEDVYDASEEEYAETWKWTALGGRGGMTSADELAYSINPRVFRLTAGQHFLSFRGREADTRLDALIVTSDANFDPIAAEQAANPAVVSLRTAGGGGLDLTWSAIPGRRYQVICTDDLATPDWTPLPQNCQAATNAIAFHIAAPSQGARFYAVVLLP